MVVKGNEAPAEKNRAAVALLDAWAADDSGYDEKVWPTVKRLLEENHSGPRALSVSSPARVYDTVLLDAGPLGKLAHPRANPDIKLWLRALLVDGIRVIVPEISDYEVRRSLILANLPASIARLDELGSTLVYSPSPPR